MKKILLLSLISLLTLTTTVPALALGPIDLDAELALNSQYVWRGMICNPDAVLQPGLSGSILGMGIGFWGNIDTSDINGNEWEFNEIDWTASYGISLPLISLDFGLIHYTFPNTEISSTTEFYASAEAGVILSPTMAIYYDFDEIDGSYIEASISHDVAFSPALNLELGAGIGFGSEGYVKGYFGGSGFSFPELPGFEEPSFGMTDYHFSAGMPFDSIPFFTITPAVTYTSLLSDAKDLTGVDDGDTDAFFYGITAAFSF